jgi:hypothetical protein
MQIRSDSKSTIEQLKGRCGIKDILLQKIYNCINTLLRRIPRNIKFIYIRRDKNIAGILLEEQRRRTRDMHEHEASPSSSLLLALNKIRSHPLLLSIELDPEFGFGSARENVLTKCLYMSNLSPKKEFIIA